MVCECGAAYVSGGFHTVRRVLRATHWTAIHKAQHPATRPTHTGLLCWIVTGKSNVPTAPFTGTVLKAVTFKIAVLDSDR